MTNNIMPYNRRLNQIVQLCNYPELVPAYFHTRNRDGKHLSLGTVGNNDMLRTIKELIMGVCEYVIGTVIRVG